MHHQTTVTARTIGSKRSLEPKVSTDDGDESMVDLSQVEQKATLCAGQKET